MSTFSVLQFYVKLSAVTVTRYGNAWNLPVCQLETKMTVYAQPMNSMRGQIFRTAYELLMERNLGWGSQMRLHLSFSITRTFFHGPHGCGRFRLLFHISRGSNLCNSYTVSNKDSRCFVSFSSNTSWVRPQRVYVLAKIRTLVPHVSKRHCVVIFPRDTKQENTATKHAVIRRSYGCNPWQSEWGFVPINVDLLLLQTLSHW